MKTITFSNLKGGTGKSSLVILTGNLLSKAGHRVLIIDSDIQNFVSRYYLKDLEIVKNKNFALTLVARDLTSNIADTVYSDNLKLVPSAFELAYLQEISEKTLSQLLPQVESLFDYCIIDTAPVFTRIVLNCLHAADLIISPCRLSRLVFTGLFCLQNKINQEMGSLNKWKILINFFRQPRTDSEANFTKQFRLSGNLIKFID